MVIKTMGMDEKGRKKKWWSMLSEKIAEINQLKDIFIEPLLQTCLQCSLLDFWGTKKKTI